MKIDLKRLTSFMVVISLLTGLFVTPVLALEPEAQTPEAYEAMFPVPERSGGDMLFSTGENLGTVLEGKTIMFIGDSLLTGYGEENYSQSWCGMLEAQYGMTVINNAVSGSTISVGEQVGVLPGQGYEPSCQRALPARDVDVVFITGGGNDCIRHIPIGDDVSARSTATVLGSMNILVDRVQREYSDALVVYMTSWNPTGLKNKLGYTISDYNEAIMELCEKRGIPFFRAYDKNVSGIDAADSAFRRSYFISEDDWWHLNARGHKRFLPIISQWLQEMMIEFCLISGFYDVTINDWYADAVAYGIEEGMIKGTSATTFEPDTVMQRAMLLTMFYRMAGTPDVSAMTHPFEDLDTEAYYYDAVVWGYNTGITTGMNETNFRPKSALTREQLATFLCRFAAAEPVDSSSEVLNEFADADEISAYALGAFAWAVGADVLHGCGENLLEPKREASRAEVVQLLANYHRLFLRG